MEANEEWKFKLLDKRVSCKQNGSIGKTVATCFYREPLTTLKYSCLSWKCYFCWLRMISAVPAAVELHLLLGR